MTNQEFAEFFKAKTKKFAVDTINFLSKLPNSATLRVIRFQLIKSVTSIAANYRAACRARSNAEFHSKISISLEEADETLFWLEMIEETNIDNSPTIKTLQSTGLEIVSVLAKARKNTKK